MKNMRKTILTIAAAAVAAVSAQAQQVIKLEPGQPVTLSSETPALTASGTGSISYQWYRDGNAISGATSASYNLPANLAHGVNVEFKRGALTPSCGGYNYSNSIIITFCLTVTVGNVCWAATNIDDYQQFAPIPDMYTKFYLWNNPTPQPVAGSVSSWPTANSATTWTNNPCPGNWRLPTQPEMLDMLNAGSVWVAAKDAVRGAAVAGRFYGPNRTTCTLPNNMTGCVFLPASGRRNTSGVLDYQATYGRYWTSTMRTTTYIYGYNFGSSQNEIDNSYTKTWALNVRCVQ